MVETRNLKPKSQIFKRKFQKMLEFSLKKICPQIQVKNLASPSQKSKTQAQKWVVFRKNPPLATAFLFLHLKSKVLGHGNAF
jgi:hypothetical protein